MRAHPGWRVQGGLQAVAGIEGGSKSLLKIEDRPKP